MNSRVNVQRVRRGRGDVLCQVGRDRESGRERGDEEDEDDEEGWIPELITAWLPSKRKASSQADTEGGRFRDSEE
jgi:hypothetical protein